jgi:hypothetical protein
VQHLCRKETESKEKVRKSELAGLGLLK